MRAWVSIVALFVLAACGQNASRTRDPARRPAADTVSQATFAAQPSQERQWWNREYGVGVVSYAAMARYAAEDVIRAAPTSQADTVAVLRRDSLCFSPGRCVRAFDRMIEYDYEIPGWAILAFNADSTWGQVSLSPDDSAGPRGWVALNGDSVRALTWPELLLDKPLFFLRSEDIAFFSSPRETAQVARQLAVDSGAHRANYIMTPLARQGDWLMVDLQTPSLMCEPTDRTPPPDTVWVRFLTPEGRPRVFYYTRGC